MKNARYEDEIKILFQKINQAKDLINDDDFFNLINEYKTSVVNHEYRISIVGEFSSGKSTFLNALIGRNILPHAKSETSATITYIHNTPKGASNEDKAVVHFNDSRQDVILDLKEKDNALDKYVRINNEIDVAHQISSVDIFIHFSNIEDNIVFVDTPGMNGVADGHRDLTLDAIQHSNVSICLFHLKGVGKTDLDFVKELMKYQDKFIFVINGIDDLKKDEGETYESRLKSFRKELSSCLPELKNIDSSTYGVSALNALAARDHTILKLYESDHDNLTEKDRERCWEISKFDILERDLYSYLSSNDKNKHFYSSIIHKLDTLISDKLNSISTTLDIHHAEFVNCPERQSLIQMKDKMKVRIDKLILELENVLGSRLDDLDHDTIQSLRNLCSQELSTLHQKINQQTFATINDFIKHNELQKELEFFNGKVSKQLSDDMYDRSEQIYNELICKLKNAMPHIVISGKMIKLEHGNLLNNEEAAFQTSISINQLQSKINEYDSKLKQNDRDLKLAQKNLEQLSSAKNEYERAYTQKQNSLCDMGSRPSVTYREDTLKRDRTGLFGGIMTRIFGQKEYTTTVRDDSECRAWDAKRQRIQKEWSMKSRSLQAMIDDLSKKSADYNPAQLTKTRALLEEKQNEYKRRLEIELQRAEEEMKIAKTSSLRTQKQHLLSDVDQYLQEPKGDLYSAFLDGIHTYSQQLQHRMKEDIHCLYNEKRKEFFRSLDLMIQKVEEGPGLTKKAKIDNLKEQKNFLTLIINRIHTIKIK